MKERPILFKGPLVRAILFGQKTVTRRLLKMPHGFWETSATDDLVPIPANCPYGLPGDRLWVRETWGLQVRNYGGGTGEHIVYHATSPDAIYCKSAEGQEYPVKWKPSIHMHRHSSRILLEITAIRVERLQDISEEQARAEGCTADDDPFWHPTYNDPDSGGRPSHRNSFEYLWGEINGPESWTANPWVWVVEFKRVMP